MKMLLKLLLIGILFYSKFLPVGTMPISDPILSSTHDINEIAVKILSKCYADHKEIVIHKNSDRLITEELQYTTSFVVIVLDDSSKINNSSQLRLHKNLFLSTPRHVSQLRKTLTTYKRTTRWNIMVPFFILDRSNQECNTARKMLKAAWRMNVIKSFFLCVNSRRVPMIYTYNPYANHAPSPWKQVQNTAKQSDGWTMFSRPHQDTNICTGMNFDRTEYLSGTVIRVGMPIPLNAKLTPNTDYDDSIIPYMYTDVAYFVEMLKHSMNVTLIYNVGPTNILDNYLKNGTCDVALQFRAASKELIYPSDYYSIYLITNDKGVDILLEGIVNYIGVIKLESMITFLTVTFIVILSSGKVRRWISSGFKILRLLLNASLYRRIDRVVLRIFFATIFLFSFIIQAEYLGKLSALVTQQKHRINAQTLDNLRDYRFNEIHLDWRYEHMITDSILRKKLVLGDRDCIENIIGNDMAACLCESDVILRSTIVHNLHVSVQPVLTYQCYHQTRSDWPLRDRFIEFLKWLKSPEQTSDDYLHWSELKMRERQDRIAAISKEHAHPISMSMFQSAVIFWLIGLKLSFMCFSVDKNSADETDRKRQIRLAKRNIAKVRRQLMSQH